MSTDRHQLAIETSGRIGSFTLACGDRLLEVVELPAQTGGAGSGGSSELMKLLDDACRRHGIKPAQFDEVYLSIGPGSFTGLRVGVTICRMFAMTVGTRIVTVPTLDVVALNAPSEAVHVAVGLNLKKGAFYSGLYRRDGDALTPIAEPALRTMEELLAIAPRPLTILGDPLPPVPDGTDGVTLLPATMARARAEHLWRLGREAARLGRFVDPLSLVPLYVRPPEAVELWDRIHGKS